MMNGSEQSPPRGSASPRRDDTERRLDSWKEIAAYLGRSVTTVQRWESEEGLPVHRHQHARRGTVFALRAELDEWLRQREARGGPLAADPPPALFGNRLRLGLGLTLIGLATVAVIGAGVFYESEQIPPNRLLVTRPLTAFAGIKQQPSFSPDRTQVAFSWNGGDQNNFDIYRMPVRGGPPERLTTHALRDGSPRWSPDGRYIAFVRYDDPREKVLMLLSLDDSSETELLALHESRRQGIFMEWMPDGKSLLVPLRDGLGEPYRIEKVAIGSGQRRVLTAPPRTDYGDFFAVPSPDSEYLAFARCKLEEDGCDILVESLHGGQERPVTAEHSSIWGLCWAPGGHQIVYASDRLGYQSLWRVNAFGARSEPIRLTADPAVAFHPAIATSGDGRDSLLAYEHLIRQDHIWRLDLSETGDRQGPVQITQTTWSDAEAVLSPDGSEIAFSSDRSGSHEIWICGKDGSNARQLTHFASRYAGHPVWSPDGTRLLCHREGDVYVTSVAGGETVRITPLSSFECAPSWSRDGNHIYYCSNRSGQMEIWRQPATGSGPARQLTRHGGYDTQEGPDGKTLYYTRHKHVPPGLYAMPVEGGEEHLVLQGARGGGWAVAQRGVYYFDFQDGSRNRYLPRNVNYYDFKTQRISTVARIAPKGVRNLLSGFDASWDGRWILWSQRDGQIEDIMIAEDPR
jgi:Tol biopolymer transport system component